MECEPSQKAREAVLEEVEMNSFIALPGKRRHSGLMPWKRHVPYSFFFLISYLSPQGTGFWSKSLQTVYKAIFVCYFPEYKIHSFHGIARGPVTEKKKAKKQMFEGKQHVKRDPAFLKCCPAKIIVKALTSLCQQRELALSRVVLQVTSDSVTQSIQHCPS